MISIFRRGIKPEQKKEPAINRDIQVFTENIAVSRLISEVKNLKDITAEQIIATAKIAEIYDELDGTPLWEKLENWSGRCKEVAADAIDDEPYLSSRLVLLLQRQDEVVSGLRLCGKALGVEPEKQFAAVYRSLIAFSTKIPERGGLVIRRFGGKYPIDLAEREKGEKNGILYIGTGAMVHLHRAVFEMRRQTTAFVTLAGDCVAAPFNAELPLGMPIKRALEFCGLSEDPTYICSGGSLTAKPVLDPETTYIEPDTKAILAFHRYDHAAPAPCIGCGRCMDVCPQQLPVFYLYAASLHKQASLLRSMGYNRCFECGACTYACPSHLDLVPVLRQGKEFAFASEKTVHLDEKEKENLPSQNEIEPAIQPSAEPLSEALPVQEAEQPEMQEAFMESGEPGETSLENSLEERKESQNIPSAETELDLDDSSKEEAAGIPAMQETSFGREVKKTKQPGQQEASIESSPVPERTEKVPEPEPLETMELPQIVQTPQSEEAEPERDSEPAKEEPSSVPEISDMEKGPEKIEELEKAEEPEKIQEPEEAIPPESVAPTEPKSAKAEKTLRKLDITEETGISEKLPSGAEQPDAKPDTTPTVEEAEKTADPKPVKRKRESVKKPSEATPSKRESEDVPTEAVKPKKSTAKKKMDSDVENVPMPEKHITPKKTATRPAAKKAKTTVKQSPSSKTAKNSQEVKES